MATIHKIPGKHDYALRLWSKVDHHLEFTKLLPVDLKEVFTAASE